MESGKEEKAQVVLITFDHLIADLASLFLSAWKAVQVWHIGNTLTAAKLSEVITQEPVVDVEDLLGRLKADIASQAAVEKTRNIFDEYLTSCRPRVNSLDWFQANLPRNCLILALTAKVTTAQRVVATWQPLIDHWDQLFLSKIQFITLDQVCDYKIDIVYCNNPTRFAQLSCKEIRGLKKIPRPPLQKYEKSSHHHVSPLTTGIAMPITLCAWRVQLPYRRPANICGKVVTGFKRGSTLLGLPTANVDVQLGFTSLNDSSEETITFPVPGAYSGFCALDHWEAVNTIFGCIMNVGFSPQFGEVKATLEVYIFHSFQEDFYDQQICVEVRSFLRPEGKFADVEELVDVLQTDCESVNYLSHLRSPEERPDDSGPSQSLVAWCKEHSLIKHSSPK